MTRFLDGPAKGKVLMLQRAPLYLRVTEKAWKFDALDLLEDTPEPGETLYVYEQIGEPGFCFIDGAKVHGRFVTAEYRICTEQPAQSILADTKSWKDWTYSKFNKIANR